ncbi:MAG: helicase-related protein [Erysipelotrichaceae bacterium]|nr:helicase-related protein [Erysipelotrichaceae bacterium]
MECKRCGNKDPTYFYKGHRGYYCRRCIKFKRVLIDEDISEINYDVNSASFDYEFNYELTPAQVEVSKKANGLITNEDVLLYCVCGAGKTEICVESISSYLAKGLKVCYAISRKEVVIELAERFTSIFPKAKVTAVYGSHHDEIYGDLIVCTTHQLYRYHNSFDLLILDEVDAFPLKGNETLMDIALKSSKGHIIFSTATIDSDLKRVLSKRKYQKISLYTRPSNKPLIVPMTYRNIKLLCLMRMYKIMRNMTNQAIIFVQSKKLCKLLYILYSKFFSSTYVYSDLNKRNENISNFKNKQYQFIFSTTVLERGITIKNVNVIIIDFIKNRFDESSYIQMLGRVGRGIDNPNGEAYVLTSYKNKNVINAIEYINKANSYL